MVEANLNPRANPLNTSFEPDEYHQMVAKIAKLEARNAKLEAQNAALLAN